MPDETHLSARQVVIYWMGPLFPKSSVVFKKRMTVATSGEAVDDMLRDVSPWHAMCRRQWIIKLVAMSSIAEDAVCACEQVDVRYLTRPS